MFPLPDRVKVSGLDIRKHERLELDCEKGSLARRRAQARVHVAAAAALRRRRRRDAHGARSQTAASVCRVFQTPPKTHCTVPLLFSVFLRERAKGRASGERERERESTRTRAVGTGLSRLFALPLAFCVWFFCLQGTARRTSSRRGRRSRTRRTSRSCSPSCWARPSSSPRSCSAPSSW